MGDGSNSTSAVRVYYVLAITAFVLPLAVMSGGGWLAWQSVLRDARHDLRQTLAVSTAQASNVLHTHLLIAERVNDLVSALDDTSVAARATPLRQRIADMIRPFPQVGGVTVSDKSGRVLLAIPSGPAPAPAVRVGPWRPSHAGTRTAAIMVVASGRPSEPTILSVLPRKNDDAGTGEGAILISVAPDYFAAFSQTLLRGDPGYAAALYRDDGALLARYPPMPSEGPPSPRNDPLMAALATGSANGIVRDQLSGGVPQLIAYRKVADYPVYATVSRSWASILRAWRNIIGTYLALGVPVMLALVALSVLAARRAQRESETLVTLRQETTRRTLAEDALRQAQKLEAVGRLTGGIAHDFNNHLTVISSNIELLKRRLPDAAPQLARLADAAMQGVRRAAMLTQRLLAFSRQQALDPEPLDASQLINGMVDLLRRTLGEAVTIKTRLGSGLWLTRVDANQLESALLSLAVNAHDAMSSGGTLSIETVNVSLDEAYAAAHAEVAAGQYVMIAIGDTGTGMPPDVQARAFEPFFTTKPFGQGTGLGLSMVHGFVHQSGGHVRIDSAPGEGATIRLYLPRYVPPTQPLVEAADLGRAAAAGSGETVLLVEDDETVRRIAAEALREIGYHVLEAPDAMEAVRLLADRGGIDLLFTDVGLPGGVNGRALADAAQNIHPALKVLFTTGYRDDAGTPAEEQHVLAKPFSLQQLETKVREVLAKPAADRAVARIESA